MVDGSIRILVAGGCNGWCVDRNNKAVSSAEMYNPETDQWTKIADMPVALNSARMELLDGVPTVIGGFNTETREFNKYLYQYFPAPIDQWRKSDYELKTPRSSPAVFKVPSHLFSEACSITSGNSDPNVVDLLGDDTTELEDDYEPIDLTFFQKEGKVSIRTDVRNAGR